MITTLLASVLLFAGGCSDNFDDSALWKGADEIYNQLTELEKQTDEINRQIQLLSAVVNGGVVTSITQDAEGNNVVRFKGPDNVEHSVTVATKDDVTTAPILGTKEEGGVLYWTTTAGGKTDFLKDTDGAKIPVAGRTPEVAVDKEGYWTVNGKRLTDAAGNPLKAEGKETSLITGVTRDANGNAVFTLGDGTTVSAPVFDAFNIVFKVGGTVLGDEYVVEDTSQPLTIGYELTGEKAGETILKIMRAEKLTAVADTAAGTITVTFGNAFEEGSFTVMLCDTEENVLIRVVRLAAKSAKPEYYGIKTAEDLRKFAEAVNSSRSYDRYRDESGDVVLLSDVDMAGTTEWTPIGTAENPFTGIFNGKNFAIKNISWTADAAKSTAHGLFGVLEKATVKNLTVGNTGDKITVTGTAGAGTAIAGVAAFATESVIESVTNNVSISFEAEDPAGTLVMLAGIAGQMSGTTIGGTSAAVKCANNGDITTGPIANTGNGGTGMQVGGICAYIKSAENNLIGYCTNNGRVNAPSGRGGGLAGTFEKGTIANSLNNGLIEDDAAGQYAGQKNQYGIKRMGGLVGGSTSTGCVIENCNNLGNVITHLGCRTGGFSGHNLGTIQNCKNTGAIIGNVTVDGANYHGPGWACGYNQSASLIKGCIGNGFVGDYDTYKDAPKTAPAAMHATAVCHKQSNYNTEENTVDWSLPAYYDWELKQTIQLHPGVKYTYYEFTNLPRKMHVLELDLTNDAVEIATSISNDLVPNPNGNNNSNNGKNIRETLSENCTRKRAEGQEIIAGINTGFFNSHDGFPRGLHIEDGRPDFVNNKTVRTSLTNHQNCFTFFKDRTVSCGKKVFTGKIEVDGVEYEYHSINDTILRRGNVSQEANLYTARYKKTPHPGTPSLTNTLLKKALYVVAKNTSGNPMTVNDGWFEATVTQIADGRTTELAEAPYLTTLDQWAVQLTGAAAEAFAGKLSVGSTLRIRADVAVDGVSTPILAQNSTMYHLLDNGVDKNLASSVYDPMTYVGVDQPGTKVYFFVIDGRQSWVSMGVKFYEMVRIAQKFGCWNVTRFDGGGSTTMWLYTDGEGKVVNKPSDSKGERSCMNYMHVRIKK